MDNDKVFESKIIPSISNFQEEISIWGARIRNKEKEVSALSIQIQHIKLSLDVFQKEYDSRVGIYYVELDKLKLNIREYQYKISIVQEKKVSPEDLESIEDEVNKQFYQERRKVASLENEASESADKYEKRLEEEENRQTIDRESHNEPRKLYRILALKYHPDMAKDENQRKKYHQIFIAINDAYNIGDLETLRKYIKQAEREEKIARETPEEKLTRLKDEYKRLLGISAKFQAELEALIVDETYLLKKKVDEARKENNDLLGQLTTEIKEEIAINQEILEEIIIRYNKIIEGLV